MLVYLTVFKPFLGSFSPPFSPDFTNLPDFLEESHGSGMLVGKFWSENRQKIRISRLLFNGFSP